MREILKSYLSIKDVDFALFINGEWGSGKTYFIKNELEEVLTSFELKVFYFTVNGISNSFELHELITSKCLSNYFTPKKIPFFGNQRDRVSTILKSIGSANNLIKALKFSDFHFPNETILVIDDIERISPNYNYDEFLGYVNREFIEHNNFKVILIGDASQERIKNSNFSTIREKYIRWMINFKSNINDVVESFIQTHKSDSNYYTHLMKHKEFLLELVNGFEIKNYRTLKFFLEIYKTIFEETASEFKDLYKDIFYFTLVISNECRKGRLKLFDNVAQLPSIVSQIQEKEQFLFYNRETGLTEDKSVSNSDEEEIKTFESNFKRYTFNHYTMMSDSGVEYHFIKPIYEFVTKGEWNIHEYKEILKRLLKARRIIITKEPNLNIDNLSAFRNLSEIELDAATDKVIEEIENGELPFDDFCRAFNFLIYLSQQELLKYNEDEIRELLLVKAEDLRLELEEQKKYADYFHFGIEVNEIEKFSKESADILKEKFQIYKKEITVNTAIEKLETWDTEIKDKDGKNIYRTIIDNCSAEQIVNKIALEFKNREFVSAIGKKVHDEYRSLNAGDYYFDDIPKLELIQELLIARNWKNLDRVDNYFIEGLIKQIDKSIDHIKETKSA